MPVTPKAGDVWQHRPTATCYVVLAVALDERDSTLDAKGFVVETGPEQWRVILQLEHAPYTTARSVSLVDFQGDENGEPRYRLASEGGHERLVNHLLGALR